MRKYFQDFYQEADICIFFWNICIFLITYLHMKLWKVLGVCIQNKHPPVNIAHCCRLLKFKDSCFACIDICKFLQY